MIELVIFDMDGLMFDTEIVSYKGWKYAIEKLGYDFSMEIFINTLGVGEAEIGDYFRSIYSSDFPYEEILKERISKMHSIIEEDGLIEKEGLRDVLSFLGVKKIKRAVATSSSKERAHSLLTKAGIINLFDYIICGDEVVKSKPDPFIFAKVAKKLECDADKVVVLEDSEYGVLAASRAGMIPIVIPDMKEPKDEILKLVYSRAKNLREVISIIENIKTEEVL